MTKKRNDLIELWRFLTCISIPIFLFSITLLSVIVVKIQSELKIKKIGTNK